VGRRVRGSSKPTAGAWSAAARPPCALPDDRQISSCGPPSPAFHWFRPCSEPGRARGGDEPRLVLRFVAAAQRASPFYRHRLYFSDNEVGWGGKMARCSSLLDEARRCKLHQARGWVVEVAARDVLRRRLGAELVADFVPAPRRRVRGGRAWHAEEGHEGCGPGRANGIRGREPLSTGE